MNANTIYLKKLLTDAGYDQHKIEGDWTVAHFLIIGIVLHY